MSTNVTINGVTYVPEYDASGLVDCDGHAVEVGDSVYVRESALAQYGMTKGFRNGTLQGGGLDSLNVRFANDLRFDFPVTHIRRAH